MKIANNRKLPFKNNVQNTLTDFGRCHLNLSSSYNIYEKHEFITQVRQF